MRIFQRMIATYIAFFLVTYLLFGGRSFLVLILFDIISKSVITFLVYICYQRLD